MSPAFLAIAAELCFPALAGRDWVTAVPPPRLIRLSVRPRLRSLRLSGPGPYYAAFCTSTIF